mmetsp:Transcript_14497/g.38548  ORF Transcript_14497/g.38548 Transcript_14497/m.38548 type:complete len:330 (-) Transcript_14497:1011-2000(-)
MAAKRDANIGGGRSEGGEAQRRPAQRLGHHVRVNEEGRNEEKLHVIRQVPKVPEARRLVGVAEHQDILQVDDIDPPALRARRRILLTRPEGAIANRVADADRPQDSHDHQRREPDPAADRVDRVHLEPAGAELAHLLDEGASGEEPAHPEEGVDREEGGGHQLIGHRRDPAALGRNRKVTGCRADVGGLRKALWHELEVELDPARRHRINDRVAEDDPRHAPAAQAIEAAHRRVRAVRAERLPVARKREGRQERGRRRLFRLCVWLGGRATICRRRRHVSDGGVRRREVRRGPRRFADRRSALQERLGHRSKRAASRHGRLDERRAGGV